MGVVCGFCGHSDAPESLRIELKETIADLIREKNVHLFYVGNHGGFDRMVLGVLQELQASFPVMRYYVVLAYHPQLSAPVSHDAPTIFPEDLETVPNALLYPGVTNGWWSIPTIWFRMWYAVLAELLRRWLMQNGET